MAQEPALLDRIYRLNAHITGNYIALDDYKRVQNLMEMVTEEMKPDRYGQPSKLTKQISRIAEVLVANLLFFEPNPSFTNTSDISQTIVLSGSICCRHARGDRPIKNLANNIKYFHYAEVSSTDPNLSVESWRRIDFRDEDRHGVSQRDGWLRVPVTVTVLDKKNPKLYLAVQFSQSRELVAISVFPVILVEFKRRAGG